MNGVAEELHGVGRIILNGIQIGEVTYSIRVQKAGPKGWLYPFARFQRRGYLELYDLLDKPITLVLEDGRRWDCCMKSLDGSVAPSGDWPAKEVQHDPGGP